VTVFVASGLRVSQEVRYGASGQTLTWICEVDGQRVTPGASPPPVKIPIRLIRFMAAECVTTPAR
jgi:hypothetical protein